jgi:hypothetical protein
MPHFVDKMRLPVRVQVSGEEPMIGFLSVSPQSALHEGPETLLELLNTAQRMVPLVMAADSSVLLLTREHLDWVAPDPSVATDLVRPRPYLVTREERVAAEWLDGRRVEGLMPMELPRELNRASDYLNGQDDFFPLVTPSGTLLVNKSRIRGVRIFGSSPRPRASVFDTAA